MFPRCSPCGQEKGVESLHPRTRRESPAYVRQKIRLLITWFSGFEICLAEAKKPQEKAV
jgi:hypothetical protein